MKDDRTDRLEGALGDAYHCQTAPEATESARIRLMAAVRRTAVTRGDDAGVTLVWRLTGGAVLATVVLCGFAWHTGLTPDAELGGLLVYDPTLWSVGL